MGRDLEFIYVGDPMCSWCWGFAPVLERMTEVYEIPIRVVVGGLRPGPDANELDEALARTLAHHWEQVAHASGQPFDHTFLERRDGWVYDTEVPAIAVVTMRQLQPESTLDFHTRLQQEFYAQAVDITDRAVYPALLEGFDVDRDDFLSRFSSEEARASAWHDFAEARSYGASGFPTLLVRDGDEYGIVTRGYLSTERLLPVLSDWLLDRYVDDGEALFCEPGTVC
ncbi:MAG: DsbA family protein [Acidimicrobiia bacterium]|nr:DsbA family protein [Acidimicrobiia bacterium]NNF08810.1 DsbA family protein [Acidimicrobiia bacterium]NNL68914.1 DsbA family protein [Acidimicrobiia bacterium]